MEKWGNLETSVILARESQIQNEAGTIQYQPRLVVEMAGIEPASKEFDQGPLQA